MSPRQTGQDGGVGSPEAPPNSSRKRPLTPAILPAEYRQSLIVHHTPAVFTDADWIQIQRLCGFISCAPSPNSSPCKHGRKPSFIFNFSDTRNVKGSAPIRSYSGWESRCRAVYTCRYALNMALAGGMMGQRRAWVLRVFH